MPEFFFHFPGAWDPEIFEGGGGGGSLSYAYLF